MAVITSSNFNALLRANLEEGIPDSRAKSELLDRLDRWGDDLVAGLAHCYKLEDLLDGLSETIIELHVNRAADLLQRDRMRILEPDWFQKPDAIGYVCYTDLFARNLNGVSQKIPYLQELGITYLHLMPLLRPRPGENDGGYAVMDYLNVREDLGDMTDLENLASALHQNGISLTLDLVLNHVAKEHDWAIRAKAGEKKYRDYFFIYPDRTIPDQFEATLPEIFPDFAPGSFSYDEDAGGWVWTTFNDFQWDLNWANPDVFLEFAKIIGFLANRGVDCLRLDAIAFIWKRMGTVCQGEPEVHSITQALRSLAKIVTPSLIFKAEAIVGPAQVGAYLGEGKHAGKVSDLAYHNSLMVQIWSSIAAKDARLFELAMSRFRAIPSNTAWGAYLRCHDDIGWAIDDTDAWQVGLNGHHHRMFLADYFTGKFYGSQAAGEDFQIDPASGERRTSGTTAGLTGLQTAIQGQQPEQIEIALARYQCAYAMVFGFGGIPLLYMGDEIALFNDHSYLADPNKKADNRWLHRPTMDWKLTEEVTAPSGGSMRVEASREIFRSIQNMIRARKRLGAMHAVTPTKVRAGSGQGVVIFERNHPAGELVQVFNLGDGPRWINKSELGQLSGKIRDEIAQVELDLGDGILLQPYEFVWLTSV